MDRIFKGSDFGIIPDTDIAAALNELLAATATKAERTKQNRSTSSPSQNTGCSVTAPPTCTGRGTTS